MSTADFKAWLHARQQAAIDGMTTTTGAEFGKHCAVFEQATTAIRVLWDFEAELSMGGAA